MDSWHGSCLHQPVAKRTSSRPPGAAPAAKDEPSRRDTRVARALQEVAASLAPSESLDDVLDLVLARTQELLECERATLYLLDEATGELVSRIVTGGQVRSIRLRVGYGIAGTVAQTGRTLRVRDAYSDPRFERDWDTLTGFRTRSMVATPLLSHVGSTIGVLQVLNKRNAVEFTLDDEELLTALGTQAAIAIDNSRLVLRLKEKNRQLLDTQAALERRVRDLQLLFDLERLTGRARTLDEMLTAVLEHVVPACEARGGAVLIQEEDSRDWVQYRLEPEQHASVHRSTARTSQGLLAWVMGEREVQVLDVTKLKTLFPDPPLYFDARSVVAASLEGEEGVMGAMALFDKRSQAEFGADDVELMRLVSANVSTALRLYRAATARERSERLTAIGRLLSQVVHDFKTPMTVISGYAQLMVDSQERTQRLEYAEEIVRQFEVVTAMQREVLEFARGDRTLFIRRIHLGAFFDEFARQVARELDGTQIELQVEVDRKAVARFDEGRMTRVLHNLVRNAIEAIGERPGRIGIRAALQDSVLLIEVTDTGPGIPAEVEGRLFQSFVTANKRGGTGLGLAMVKRTVEEHQGTVSVESSPRGASFQLRLPQPPSPIPASPPAKNTGLSAGVRRRANRTSPNRTT